MTPETDTTWEEAVSLPFQRPGTIMCFRCRSEFKDESDVSMLVVRSRYADGHVRSRAVYCSACAEQFRTSHG